MNIWGQACFVQFLDTRGRAYPPLRRHSPHISLTFHRTHPSSPATTPSPSATTRHALWTLGDGLVLSNFWTLGDRLVRHFVAILPTSPSPSTTHPSSPATTRHALSFFWLFMLLFNCFSCYAVFPAPLAARFPIHTLRPVKSSSPLLSFRLF